MGSDSFNPRAEPTSRPESDLAAALGAMGWEVLEGTYALVGLPGGLGADELAPLLRGPEPRQLVVEGGETTLLLPEAEARGLLASHPDARVEGDLAWVRFELAMDWELVGFLAHVTGALARAGIPLGAVCGFSRDHLFLARRYLEPARAVLEELFPTAG